MINLNVLIQAPAFSCPSGPVRIEIPYGEGRQVVELPERNVGDIIYPKETVDKDEGRILLDAIRKPIGSSSFSEFLGDSRDVLVIVNDATRPTPSGRILKMIGEMLQGRSVSCLVATGMHRAPTEEEYRQIFGDLYDTLRSRVCAHDSKNSETVHVGESKNGTQLKLNKKVIDAERIVVISSVEPHYFAGYTGGRKSFLPGVAAFETIEQNHRLALSLDAQALRLDGNPVNEDMEDAMNALRNKKIFSIMVVLDKNHKIAGACAGDLRASFREAVKLADKVFVINMKSKADVVVAVTAFPYDIDLYQSQKALDNSKYAVKDGGVIVLVSACRDGVGPDTFLKLLGSAATPREALDKISQMYKLGYHKAAKMAEIGLKCKVMAVTGLDQETARKAHLTPMGSVQEAVDQAIEELGPEAKVTFMMDAVITVPKVQ